MKFQLNLVKSILAVAGVAALSAVSAAPASAFSFGNIGGGDNTYGDTYADQFSFDVKDGGSNNVIFNIANNTSLADMFIGAVYFDTGSNSNLLSAFGVDVGNTGLVNFEDSGTANMAQSGNLSAWSTDFSATKTGAASSGVHGGEILGLSFTGNYNNVVSALNAGTLRLGLHVQGIGRKAEYSDSFVSTISAANTEATPEPLTMLAAGAAVGFGTMFKKQRARAQKAE
ncbi:PEP-CTERM sorting domain-containing protein [Microcoleus vaginatus]|uniref:PEP-CTERM sorting domain-containing protein n=1 Tax=Microcoleus vaginatus TaxID=119532 RepID=UPI001F620AB0|nr:PEP-CTERM sorting domain-containing protein [Microcoleus vaginatus HSN003]